MKLIAKIADQLIPVEVTRKGESFTVVVGSKSYSVDSQTAAEGNYSLFFQNRICEVVVLRKNDTRTVHLKGEEIAVALQDYHNHPARPLPTSATAGRLEVKAQMPGKVVRVLVGAGERVDLHQGLLVLEAMKMQNEIKSPKAGRVAQLAVVAEKAVNAGDLLMVIE